MIPESAIQFRYFLRTMDFENQEDVTPFIDAVAPFMSHDPGAGELALRKKAAPLEEHLSLLSLKQLHYIWRNVDKKAETMFSKTSEGTALPREELIERLTELIPAHFRQYLEIVHPQVIGFFAYETLLPIEVRKLYGKPVFTSLIDVTRWKYGQYRFHNPSLFDYRKLMLGSGFAMLLPHEESTLCIQYPQEIMQIMMAHAGDRLLQKKHAETFDILFAAETSAWLYGRFSHIEVDAILKTRLKRNFSQKKITETLDELVAANDYMVHFCFSWEKDQGIYRSPGEMEDCRKLMRKIPFPKVTTELYVQPLNSLSAIFCYGFDITLEPIEEALATLEKALGSRKDAYYNLQSIFVDFQDKVIETAKPLKRVFLQNSATGVKRQVNGDVINTFLNWIPLWRLKGTPQLAFPIEELERLAGEAKAES